MWCGVGQGGGRQTERANFRYGAQVVVTCRRTPIVSLCQRWRRLPNCETTGNKASFDYRQVTQPLGRESSASGHVDIMILEWEDAFHTRGMRAEELPYQIVQGSTASMLGMRDDLVRGVVFSKSGEKSKKKT